jgi:hypothetical protein
MCHLGEAGISRCQRKEGVPYVLKRNYSQFECVLDVGDSVTDVVSGLGEESEGMTCEDSRCLFAKSKLAERPKGHGAIVLKISRFLLGNVV